MMMKADDLSIKKPLLPIKTKDGILRRYTLEKDEIGKIYIILYLPVTNSFFN